MNDLISRSALIEEINNLLKSPYANFEEPFSKNKSRKDGIETVLQVCVGKAPIAYDVEKVLEDFKECVANFDCRICKYNKTEGQVCLKDCTEALIDGLFQIVKRGGVDD